MLLRAMEINEVLTMRTYTCTDKTEFVHAGQLNDTTIVQVYYSYSLSYLTIL